MKNLKESYSSRASASRAMWSYVRSLQRDGIHTGALSGDNGNTAQWIGNDGRTHYATVDHNECYYIDDRRYTIRVV